MNSEEAGLNELKVQRGTLNPLIMLHIFNVTTIAELNSRQERNQSQPVYPHRRQPNTLKPLLLQGLLEQLAALTAMQCPFH